MVFWINNHEAGLVEVPLFLGSLFICYDVYNSFFDVEGTLIFFFLLGGF